jgi:hypothetical protein
MTCVARWIRERAWRRTAAKQFRRPLVVLVLVLVLAVACGDGDGAEPQWAVVFEELDGALFSVWGTSHDDVWAVGADAGDGPLVLHFDGARWVRPHTGAQGDLWWVSGHGDHVWMSGADGLVLRYVRSEDRFEAFDTPGSPTLVGIFPTGVDDVWAVGGVAATREAAAYRFEGAAFDDVDDLPAEGMEDTLFKVWGRSAEDLWVVGLGSVSLHRGPGGWTVEPVPMGRPLFTVHGGDDLTVAVGGIGTGLLVESTGQGWVDRTPPMLPQMNGVWVRPDGRALAVGNDGALWARGADGTWAESPDPPITELAYHAAFVDPEGGEWAVGGRIIAPPFERGLLVHRGEPVPTVIEGL